MNKKVDHSGGTEKKLPTVKVGHGTSGLKTRQLVSGLSIGSTIPKDTSEHFIINCHYII